MKKLFHYACLLALPLLLGACDEEEKETPLPEPEASLNRTFDFKNADEDEKATYTLGAFESHLVLENGKLELAFSPAAPTGKDALVFKIKSTDIPSGYVGKYSVKSLPETEAGKAETTYYHYLGTGGGSALMSGGNTMAGEVEITAFDTQNQLASGKFEITMPDAYDPTRYNPNLDDARKCDITVTGFFKNLRLVRL
ncbi:hypothetical protein [Pontibacter roseus]|uniref:hypothetical protein n=1 Tax=Pontibacter roseus TaxID=336989 RepID=UPI000382C402|nr:hypothetical protein [Pontibacter roseus]